MKRIKVLLVKSRSVVSRIRGTSLSLGLVYIAAYLREKAGARVKIVDVMYEKDPMETVLAALGEFEPDIAGISALTAEAFLAHKIAALIKRKNPGLPVIIGGPYPSADPEDALENPGVDIAVIGEGEETFAEIAALALGDKAALKNLGVLKKIKGIAFRNEGATEITPPRPPIEDLDALPFPAWDIYDYKKFWIFGRGGMATIGPSHYFPLFTSRGCPYHCVYCHQLFGKKFRARSPENVVEEVKWLMEMGANHIEVLDDIANFDKNRFNAILEKILENNLHPLLSFPNAVRADLMEEESINLLKRIGTGEISIAVETASPRLQKLLNKNLNLEKTRRVIEMFEKRRIFTRGFFMLGLPTETEKEMRETIKFAHDSKLHLALFFTPNPYKNTRLYQMFLDTGKMPPDITSIDYEYFGSPFNGSEVPDEKYRILYRRAYYGFYFNPSRMWRIARDRPCKRDMPARALGLFRHFVSFRRLKEN